MQGCLGHLKSQLLKEGVSLSVHTAFDGGKFKDALGQSVQHVVSNVIGGVSSNIVGGLYHDDHIDTITHKLSHAIIGATEGMILGDVKAGALGAVIAESLAETIKPLFDTLEGAADTAKVITAGILGTFVFDVETAIATATVAVENNFRSIIFNSDIFDDWTAEDIQAMSTDEALAYLKEHRELMHRDDKVGVDWFLDNPEEVAFLFLPCGQIVKVGRALLATKAMTKVGNWQCRSWGVPRLRLWWRMLRLLKKCSAKNNLG
jgi:hypothetical protein